MKTCVVTATYGCAPNKVWLYMTNPTLNSWNPTVASAEVDLEGMHIVEKNKDGTTTDIHFDKLDKPRRISCTFTRGKIRGAFTAILLGSADSTSLECTLDVEGLGLFAKPRKKLEEYEHPRLSVLDTNARAIALYRRMGWKFTGEKDMEFDPAEYPSVVKKCVLLWMQYEG